MFKKVVNRCWKFILKKNYTFSNLHGGLMERQQINSGEIQSVGYEPLKRTLEIEFSTGEIIQYYNVPEKIYQGLMRTESHAKYFGALIKNFYKSCRVG